MAIVTLKVQLRRVEGRSQVLASDLAAELSAAIEGLDELEVGDVQGDDAVYQVTRVTWLHEDTAPPASPIRRCRQCGTVLQPGYYRADGLGRPRQYCSDACRQAAHRHRLASHPAPVGAAG